MYRYFMTLSIIIALFTSNNIRYLQQVSERKVEPLVEALDKWPAQPFFIVKCCAIGHTFSYMVLQLFNHAFPSSDQN